MVIQIQIIMKSLLRTVMFGLTMVLIIATGGGLFAQTNVSVATATLVNSFPYTETDLNSSGGGSATGMNGSCSTIPCCSTLVYRIEIPTYGSLRGDMTNFRPLAGTMIAYTPDIDIPLDYSDLTFFPNTGNFCGFRDSLQLGFKYNWETSQWWGTPDINDPYDVCPPGTYYVLFFNNNQQSGNGSPTSDVTFQFAPFCPNGGDTIYVDKSANGNNDGSSFADAYTSLHDALTIGTSCDQLWIAKGTYVPSQESDGSTDSPRDYTFSIPLGLKLYGGFDGTEIDLNERIDFASGEVNETIFSGDINGNDDGSTNTTWDNTYAVVSSTTNIFDITISGGNAAKRLFVKYDASGSNNGTSWNDAYNSLQSALDVAVSGDEIWVARGTYYPSQETDGTIDNSRKYSFQMIDGVAIYGSFAGTETTISQRTNFSLGGASETTLSGDFNLNDIITGSGATLAITGNSENCYHIFDHPSGYTVTSTAILDGFTIKGG